jgi:hypothetical protein
VVLDYPVAGPPMPNWFYEEIGSDLRIDETTLEAMREELTGIDLDDSGAIRALVKQTDEIAVAAYETIRDEVEAGELVVLGLPTDQGVILRPLLMLIATLGDHTLPPSAPVVISELIAVIQAAPESSHP